jgi:tRNA A37 threonylcarbamoyladenosine biosynthesis protein TsaE
MTVATAKAVAARFLTSDQPEVLALKGAWGVGKTYAWNKTVLECKDDIKLPNYCYAFRHVIHF